MAKDKTKPIKKNIKNTKKLHDIFEGQDDYDICCSTLKRQIDNDYYYYGDGVFSLKAVLLTNLFVFIFIVLFSPIIIVGLVLTSIYFIIHDLIIFITEDKPKRRYHDRSQ